MYDLHSYSMKGKNLTMTQIKEPCKYRNINTNIPFITTINFDQPKQEMINKQDF